jgi:hypothetical protein
MTISRSAESVVRAWGTGPVEAGAGAAVVASGVAAGLAAAVVGALAGPLLAAAADDLAGGGGGGAKYVLNTYSTMADRNNATRTLRSIRA